MATKKIVCLDADDEDGIFRSVLRLASTSSYYIFTIPAVQCEWNKDAYRPLPELL